MKISLFIIFWISLFNQVVGMESDSKIWVAGHRGLVGSAIVRELQANGYSNLILKSHEELDLSDQRAVQLFFAEEKPEYVFIAAAKVGGILAVSYTHLTLPTNREV